MKRCAAILGAIIAYSLFPWGVFAQSGLSISSVTDNRASYTNSQIPKYEKFEVTFSILNSIATNPQFPYDPSPPAGVNLSDPLYKGISVDAEFLPPGETDWNKSVRQPAFFYRDYLDGGTKQSWANDGQNVLSYEWFYPSGQEYWKVRFAPHKSGSWQYRLRAQDGQMPDRQAVTQPATFTVITSDNKGFIRVGKTDPRYFEFDDGSLFNSFGVEEQLTTVNPISSNNSQLSQLSQNKIQLIRTWHSGLYGSSWLEWLGGRGIYDGYLPRSGLEAFHDSSTNRDQLTLALSNNNGWYDACRFDAQNGSVPVKPNTNYRLQIKYQAVGISNRANPAYTNYGFVGIISNPLDWPADCNDPSAFSVGDKRYVTNFGKNTTGWETVSGTWNSGNLNFLPRIAFGLNNVSTNSGVKAWVDSISLREIDANGNVVGPEILPEPSLQYDRYFKDYYAYRLDKAVEQAEKNNIYLKFEIMEKNDMVWLKSHSDGTYVVGGENDNIAGIYGNQRNFNRTRWLQQAYWRYLQARWGYSTAIHSWEAMNEGDPYNSSHWALTDEMAKYFHCGVFGATIGTAGSDQHQASQKCTYQQPNRHMVTTSFWTGFPGYSSQTGDGFWGSPVYPNVDYADGHAYISTSEAPLADKQLMEKDSAYYHLWHSQAWPGWNLPFPVVRGEAGMVPAQGSTDDWGALGIQSDMNGIWFHKYVWSGLDAGALYEIYWYYHEHIVTQNFDHRPIYKIVAQFTQDIPLNNGNYKDLGATVSNSNLRVIGQKDTVNGNAYLWVDNKNHTWKNVVDGVSISPQSGTVTIGGFQNNKQYTLETWNTYTGTKTTGQVTSSATGTIALSVNNLATDTAYKIINPTSPSPTITPTAQPPSPTPTPVPGDVNGDGSVNLTDLSTLLANFGRSETGIGKEQGDLDGNGSVNLSDLSTLLANFGKSG